MGYHSRYPQPPPDAHWSTGTVIVPSSEFIFSHIFSHIFFFFLRRRECIFPANQIIQILQVKLPFKWSTALISSTTSVAYHSTSCIYFKPALHHQSILKVSEIQCFFGVPCACKLFIDPLGVNNKWDPAHSTPPVMERTERAECRHAAGISLYPKPAHTGHFIVLSGIGSKLGHTCWDPDTREAGVCCVCHGAEELRFSPLNRVSECIPLPYVIRFGLLYLGSDLPHWQGDEQIITP